MTHTRLTGGYLEGPMHTRPMDYTQGQPCKQGEAAARTGCIPASGEAGPGAPAGAESGLPDVGRSMGHDEKIKAFPLAQPIGDAARQAWDERVDDAHKIGDAPLAEVLEKNPSALLQIAEWQLSGRTEGVARGAASDEAATVEQELAPVLARLAPEKRAAATKALGEWLGVQARIDGDLDRRANEKGSRYLVGKGLSARADFTNAIGEATGSPSKVPAYVEGVVKRLNGRRWAHAEQLRSLWHQARERLPEDVRKTRGIGGEAPRMRLE